MDPNLTRSLVTDSKRLQQVLKNLLSNAFKFTEKGGVRLSVFAAENGWSEGHPVLGRSAPVIAFEVTDTGIGIPPEKQRIIFEAFQQADAGTSRKYGGTGLGLAISRELAGLLGGEIQLRSTPDEGSTFTLYLPQTYVGPSTGTASAEAKASVMAATQGQLATAAASKRAIEQIAVKDDRENLQPDDATLLIVEDDPTLRPCYVTWLAKRDSKSLWRLVARKLWLSPRSSIRRPFPLTSSCRTCSAGQCSTI